ncbi:MAG: nitronate monooxygenase [Chlamydiia bacterium]|nr:nitronate monooxygenase [Chlamydiia bacterium]
MKTPFTEQVGIEVPLICGAMYPCSNPELVAAASEAGAIGIIQPLSLVYVHGYDFRDGLKKIRSLTQKPVGINILVEKSTKIYEHRMREWLEIALEEGVRFVVTALGNPEWVVEKVHAKGGVVYHDVTERKWAEKALSKGVDGLICVNNRAGGHAGKLSPEALYQDLKDLKVPLICAGGVGDENTFTEMIKIGYAGVQMGTRFIATEECHEKHNYKEAIVKAQEDDIVLTNRVTGIPLSVIKTPYVEAVGTDVGPVTRFLLQHRLTKHFMRLIIQVLSARKFKQTTLKGGSTKDYWQAGKSCQGIRSIESVSEIIDRFKKSLGNNPELR